MIGPTEGETVDASTVGDVAIPTDMVKAQGGGVAFFLEAGALLLLVPVALYFWFIHQYGVNAIYYDQWNDVALLTHTPYYISSFSGVSAYSGHTSIGMLWYQHLNTLTELYLSALLHLIAVSLVIVAHRRDVARLRLIFYLPVAFLMLTLGQFENILFGYELSWCLVIATLAAAIFFLDDPKFGWLVFVAAVVMAVIGSYSALQGLLIWPAGLVVLLWKHRPRVFVVTWLISAIATTCLYFYHFDFSAAGGSHGYVLSHPASAVEFFFFDIGDIVGKPLPVRPGASDPAIVVAGVAVFLLVVACLTIYGRRRTLSRSPVGPALISFGILFDVMKERSAAPA